MYNISSEGEKITGAHFDVVLRTVRRTITDGDVEECVKFIRKFEPIKPFYTVSVSSRLSGTREGSFLGHGIKFIAGE